VRREAGVPLAGEAVARGLLLREGAGHRTSPFRYWLPGQEEKWKDDPAHALQELLWQDRRMRAEFEERFGGPRPAPDALSGSGSGG
jgi:hypothetical protein